MPPNHSQTPQSKSSPSTNRKPSINETLLQAPLQVVNVGLDSFADDLAAQDVPVARLDWSPPRELDPKLVDLLKKLGM